MNLFRLAVIISFCVCPFAAFGQSENRDGQTSSFFQTKLGKFKEPIAESHGGESGGGGEWLESKLAQTSHIILESLKKNNPHNLNLQEFAELIEKTEIKLSDKSEEFFLNTKNGRRDAINFFPQRLLLKIYSPKWTEYYRDGLDVTALLYHEYLPFFFGNDLKYIRAREAQFVTAPAPIFDNVIDADFSSELQQENSNCLTRLKFNRIRKIVTFSWVDNHITGTACDSAPGDFVFQCANQLISDCTATPNSQTIMQLSMTDPFSFKLEAQRQGSSQKIADKFKRIDLNSAGKEISNFSEFATHDDFSLGYAAICEKAYLKAEQKALQACQAKASALQVCETIDSEVVQISVPPRLDQCAVSVKVQLSKKK